MDFFGMGMGEILLILVVALIIWGPGRIVDIAKTLGKTVRALKKASFDLTTQITKELEGQEKDRSSQPRVNSSHKPKELSDVGKAEPKDVEVASPREK